MIIYIQNRTEQQTCNNILYKMYALYFNYMISYVYLTFRYIQWR